MPPSYEPTSRRPIANIFRATARASVAVCLRCHIHPDAVSYASLVASALAAVCFYFSLHHPWLLIIGPLLCYVRLWFNMLDGMVAMAAGLASRRGEILNDLPDRLSDVMIFVAVAESGWCRPWLGYWVALVAVLTAYVGTISQAVGARRQFGGVMSKPWRMVALHVGAWVALAAWYTHGPRSDAAFGQPLDWTLVVILLGCVQTIIVRLRRTMIELASSAPSNSSETELPATAMVEQSVE